MRNGMCDNQSLSVFYSQYPGVWKSYASNKTLNRDVSQFNAGLSIILKLWLIVWNPYIGTA